MLRKRAMLHREFALQERVTAAAHRTHADHKAKLDPGYRVSPGTLRRERSARRRLRFWDIVLDLLTLNGRR